ncbi:hypothetical protein NIES4071_51000 [Calothrix sp. NIES-4071]|nr:hypothetical protein NIES4071_51000 [Calothrix sp. NIES-4071]BAZ59408.1 hypothetical protein NIES4105_50950 [Calothrix sp. NIES-4105]
MVNFNLSKTSAEASKFAYSVLIDQEQDGKEERSRARIGRL